MSSTLPLVVEIEECRRAHERLLVTITGLSDEQVRAKSQLPGWSRAHVLSHLAGNAASVVRRLSAAAEGRIVDQYEGGFEARRGEIERGATQPASELVEQVRRSARAVEAIFDTLSDEVWARPIRAVDGPERPARMAVFSRWREVEAHHVDLDLGYHIQDWPSTLVERWLPGTIEGLAERADSKELLGWLLGRGPAPTLAPWG